MPKKLLPDYFTFTKKERIGTTVLLLLILLFTLAPFVYPLFITSSIIKTTAFEKEIATLTGCSINTALGRMRYGLINLRKMMVEKQIAL